MSLDTVRLSFQGLYAHASHKHATVRESAPLHRAPPPSLLEQVRDAIRLRHYSLRTEQAYLDWIKRFILFHHERHPKDMGAAEVEQFLSHLAVESKVAASTQNQALSALLFLRTSHIHEG